MIQLGEHFGSDDHRRHSEWLRQQRWFIKARQIQERRDEVADKLEDDFLAFAAETVIATAIQIEKFEAKLDVYDEVTVQALMLNQEQLDAINIQIQLLLDRAYVMEDGRRVFKTEDGSQVFDESGAEVSSDELDFDAISSDKPTWETYQPLLQEKLKLEAERTDIIEFQEKVDAVREKIADGEISKSELDELDAELAEAMPPSVKAHVPGFDNAEVAPKLKGAFSVPASPASRMDGSDQPKSSSVLDREFSI